MEFFLKKRKECMPMKSQKYIGAYEVLGRLGRGGMATVYKAKAPFTSRIVAIKILKPRDDIFVDLVGWGGLCKAFLDEARVMAEMEHFAIAQVVDYGEHEGAPFVVLEYYSHSVGAVIGEGYKMEAGSRVLGERRIVHYLENCLQGLVRLHSSGVVHRDLKPYNLMLTNDDGIKIIDFGLSRVRGEEMMNVPGLQVGSPFYTAPELRKNPESADHRADLFSLGVMAYRMLTGTLFAFDGKSLQHDIKDHWRDFVEKSLQKDPALRFNSAEDMLVALENVREGFEQEIECSHCVSVPRLKGPRKTPQRILFKDVQDKLNLDDLFRPKQYSSQKMLPHDDFIVEDSRTGHVWQRRGAGYTMTWQQAHDYVAGLNSRRWKGRVDWRIPTLEELLTILCLGRTAGSHCHNKVFSSQMKWLWSADESTKRQAWIVDFSESYIDRLDRDGAASLCAVAGGREEI